VIAVGPAAGPAAIVKIPHASHSPAALGRQLLAVTQLAARPDLSEFTELLPSPIAQGRVARTYYSVEQALPGVEASAALTRRDADISALLSTAAEAIGRLHSKTGAEVDINSQLLDCWINRRLDIVVRAGGSPDKAARLAETLQRAFSGRRLSVSWIHGDFHLGNVLTTPSFDRVTGLIDWEWAAPQELPAHDVVYLLLHARMIGRGRELGTTLREVLRAGWERSEITILRSAGIVGPKDVVVAEEVLRLVWLRHVAMNLIQDPGYAMNPIWLRSNVSPLLER
jgi:Ser/Thr protein kinase RdoA (MazF antagonist)